MVQKGEEVSAQRMTCNRGRKQSQDILVWAQCFAMYLAMVSGRWPRPVPAMMAYMINIIKASQEYEGLAWFLYDEAYRRQAAATGHTEWSKVNPSIFMVCFTAKAKRGKRCEWCLSLTHDSSEYTRSEGESVRAVRLTAMEEGVGVTMPSSGSRGPPVGYELSEVCTLVENAPHWCMLVTPAVRAPGLTWITSDEHDACSPLLGIILTLKYHPPNTPLAPLLVPLGPSPVRQ